MKTNQVIDLQVKYIGNTFPKNGMYAKPMGVRGLSLRFWMNLVQWFPGK